MIVAPGTTSFTGYRFLLVDDAGLILTGKVAADMPNIYYTTGTNSAAVQITLSDLAAITSTYSSGGVKEDTGSAGMYRLDIPDAVVATGGRRIRIYGEASGKHVLCEPIDCQYVQGDLQTIKTQAVTCAAGVTIRADVGAAAAPGAANGMLIGGSNAATTFATLTSTGAFTINGTSDVAQTGDSFARIGAAGVGLTAVALTGTQTFSNTGTWTGNIVGTLSTLTTYTGNTPQTGDSFARIGVAGVGLTNLGDSRIADLDATVSSRASATVAPSWYTAPGTAPTVGQIATAVWQDTTAGDFTTAGSIGKSLFTSGNAPGAASGLALVGSNVGTATSVSGAVGSVTGNVGGNVVGSVGSISGVTFPVHFSALSITVGGAIGEVVLVDTITTYTGNTPQTGDAFPGVVKCQSATYDSAPVSGNVITLSNGHTQTISSGGRVTA